MGSGELAVRLKDRSGRRTGGTASPHEPGN